MNSSLSSPSHSSTAGVSKRLLSLHALRGFDMLMILGADDSLYALRQTHPAGLIGLLGAQFKHADWEGFRFYDLIFPLFIFLVGISITFSLGKHRSEAGRGAAYRRIGRR